MTIEGRQGTEPGQLRPLAWRRLIGQPGAGIGRPSTAGRRPRLTLDAVVSAAIEVADAGGLPAVSMSRLAVALGVGTMTLYSYVPSRADLIDLMVDEVLVQRALPSPGDDRPGGWRRQVELYADRTRTMYRRHPWLCYVAQGGRPIGPGVLAEREYVLSTLAPTGLEPDRLTAAALALIVFVDATVRMQTEGEQSDRGIGDSECSWWHERPELRQEYVDRYPTVARMWRDRAGAGDGNTDALTFGLPRLLDGIQAAGA